MSEDAACPGDEALRALLWAAPTTWSQELLWHYFSSRPRRYHLEPRVVRLVGAKFSSCRDRLEVRVVLAHRRATAKGTSDLDGEVEFWLAYDDLILNPAHARVVAGYRALYDRRLHVEDRPHVPHQPDVEYRARRLRVSKPKSIRSLASSVPSTP